MGFCKICGAPFTMTGVAYSMIITPTCRCGKIRKQVREKGCPYCFTNMIDLELHFGEYTAICRKCGREWWVREDVI